VPGHVRVPIEIALDAPGFVEGLPPLLAGVDECLQAGEIEFAFSHFFARRCFDHAENRPGLVDDFLAFSVRVVAFDPPMTSLSSRFSRS